MSYAPSRDENDAIDRYLHDVVSEEIKEPTNPMFMGVPRAADEIQDYQCPMRCLVTRTMPLHGIHMT